MSRPFTVSMSESDPYLATLKMKLEPHHYAQLEKTDLLRQVTENSLKGLRIAAPSDTNPIITIKGPEPQPRNANEPIHSYHDLVSAQTISTYPLRNENDTIREGDPICDRYGYCLFSNRSFAVVADGCNWGEGPKRAAETAVNTILNFLHEKHLKITTVGDASSYLLRGFYRAHKKICEQTDPNDSPGTTTLIAGISFPIVTDVNSDWVFVYASVGDCKAFLVRPSTNEISDITDQNRVGQQHHADCGGRLGPISATGDPDVRNLTTRAVLCQPGDLIFLVSDGVHDNLHPRILGLKPQALGLNYEWADPGKGEDVERFSTTFRVELMKQIFGNIGALTPSMVVKKLVNHGSLTTQSSRDWMCQNPGKRLPRDYERFPGKMDHTTCLCFSIGTVQDGHSATPSSSSSSSSSASPASPSSAAQAPPAGTPDAYKSLAQLSVSKPLPVTPPIGQPFVAQPDTGFVPIAITATLNANKLTLYCKTVTHTKFQCVGTAHKIQLMTTGIQPVQLRPNEEVFGGINEIGQTYNRIIQLPQHMRIRNKDFINVHDNGTIVIQFDLEILPH